MTRPSGAASTKTISSPAAVGGTAGGARRRARARRAAAHALGDRVRDARLRSRDDRVALAVGARDLYLAGLVAERETGLAKLSGRLARRVRVVRRVARLHVRDEVASVGLGGAVLRLAALGDEDRD